jgi:hypothetical protein
MAKEFKVSDLATHVATLHRFLGDCMIDADKNTDAKISRDCAPVRDSAQALLDLVGPGEATDSDPADPSDTPEDKTRGKQERAMDNKSRRRLAVDWSDPRMQNASEGSPQFDHGPRRAPAPLIGDIFGGESTPDDAPSIDNIFGR